MKNSLITENIDYSTLEGFADQWARFDQSGVSIEESLDVFESYFKIFPWHKLTLGAEGFDVGCGSGRWARHVAPRVGRLHCVDASQEVVDIARRNLAPYQNCAFHVASVAAMPIAEKSLDFGYCLGVLHHVPDTLEGIRACVSKLKPGAPFLLYLYYAFDNRPSWFRLLWKVTDWVRYGISRCPHGLRYLLSEAIAFSVYLPLSRTANLLEKMGCNVSSVPLSSYRHRSLYTLRTDARDRFGTRLERRFTATEISTMMQAAGLERITFNDQAPYWCAVGYRKA